MFCILLSSIHKSNMVGHYTVASGDWTHIFGISTLSEALSAATFSEEMRTRMQDTWGWRWCVVGLLLK